MENYNNKDYNNKVNYKVSYKANTGKDVPSSEKGWLEDMPKEIDGLVLDLDDKSIDELINRVIPNEDYKKDDKSAHDNNKINMALNL